MVKFSIRRGSPSDNIEVEHVTREAFWNVYFPGCDEHLVIHNIWTHRDFIPELYFIAVVEDKIVGSIVFTKSYIIKEGGDRLETATFGPVCVLPEHQHSGIGAELIKTGITGASKMGYPAIIILGDPHNYCRYGFKNSKDLKIADSRGKFPLGQLILKLGDDGMISKHSWRFYYSDVYNVNSNEVEMFDRRFPRKEKTEKHSQDLFAMLIRAYIE